MRTDAKVYVLVRNSDSEIITINGSLKNLLERVSAEAKSFEAPERTDILNHLRVGQDITVKADKQEYTLTASKLEVLRPLA